MNRYVSTRLTSSEAGSVSSPVSTRPSSGFTRLVASFVNRMFGHVAEEIEDDYRLERKKAVPS